MLSVQDGDLHLRPARQHMDRTCVATASILVGATGGKLRHAISVDVRQPHGSELDLASASIVLEQQFLCRRFLGDNQNNHQAAGSDGHVNSLKAWDSSNRATKESTLLIR